MRVRLFQSSPIRGIGRNPAQRISVRERHRRRALSDSSHRCLPGRGRNGVFRGTALRASGDACASAECRRCRRRGRSWVSSGGQTVRRVTLGDAQNARVSFRKPGDGCPPQMRRAQRSERFFADPKCSRAGAAKRRVFPRWWNWASCFGIGRTKKERSTLIYPGVFRSETIDFNGRIPRQKPTSLNSNRAAESLQG